MPSVFISSMSYGTIGHTGRFVSYGMVGSTGHFVSYETVGPMRCFVFYGTIGPTRCFVSYGTFCVLRDDWPYKALWASPNALKKKFECVREEIRVTWERNLSDGKKSE